jgi:ribonuclease VapC
MVIDTSALMAMFLNEPECTVFEDLILKDTVRMISAVSLFETAMVVETRLGPTGAQVFDRFLRRSAIEIVPVDGEFAREALAAWRRYGKRRHAAGLNFGDCFSYALAQSTGEPLLAKGDDFPRTDVVLCWP